LFGGFSGFFVRPAVDSAVDRLPQTILLRHV
jgi:hypothetical protein